MYSRKCRARCHALATTMHSNRSHINSVHSQVEPTIFSFSLLLYKMQFSTAKIKCEWNIQAKKQIITRCVTNISCKDGQNQLTNHTSSEWLTHTFQHSSFALHQLKHWGTLTLLSTKGQIQSTFHKRKLWQIAATNYQAIYVHTDEQNSTAVCSNIFSHVQLIRIKL